MNNAFSNRFSNDTYSSSGGSSLDSAIRRCCGKCGQVASTSTCPSCNCNNTCAVSEAVEDYADLACDYDSDDQVESEFDSLSGFGRRCRCCCRCCCCRCCRCCC